MNFIKFARISMYVLISIVVITTIAIIGVKMIEPKIEGQIVRELDKILPYGYSQSDISATIFEKFPSLSAHFQDIVILGSDSSEFITAEDLYLNLDTWALIKGEIIIDAINLKHGNIHVLNSTKNIGNWNIFAKADTSSQDSELNIKISEAELDDMHIHYDDKFNDQDYRIMVKNGTIEGTIINNDIDLDIDLNTTVGKFMMGSTLILQGKDVNLAGNLFIDLSQNYYQFTDCVLSSGSADIKVSGHVKSEEDATRLSFQYNTGTLPISEAIDLLPVKEQKVFNEYTLGGSCIVNGNIDGAFTKSKIPELSINISIDDGSVKSDLFKKKITKLNSKLTYIQNAYGIGDLNIKKVNGLYGSQKFNGHSLIKNVSKPIVNMSFEGTLPLNLLLTKERNDKFYATDGNVEFENFYIQNYQPYATHNKHAEMGGKFHFKNFEFVFNDKEALISQASTELTKDDILIVDKFEFAHKDSKISFKGSVKNLVLSIFRSDKRKKTNFDLSMTAPFVNLAEMSSFLSTPASESNEHTAFYEPLKGLRGTIRADISEFSYKKITGADFKGKLFFNLYDVDIDGSLNTCEGKMNLNGTLDYENAPVFTGKSRIENINVKQLFEQWDNFTQSVVTHQHLDGNINAAALLKMNWDNKGNYLSDKLDAKVSVNITEGKLQDFELLETFSSYVDINELRNINFSELNNIILVRDGNVYLPTMFIQNNAMNLIVNGIHTFDQKIDYNIKVNAGQVLSQKFKSKVNSTLVPAKKKGWFNLYFTVTGDLNDDFDYEQDRKKVKSSFWQSIDLRDRLYGELSSAFHQLPSPLNAIEWDDDRNESIEMTAH